MHLVRAHVRNFKLLEDVEVEFSRERERPLTAIRAENGSGKTSLLYAFQWAFHGMNGLPSSARSLRLTSSATPSGKATSVSVMIEFEISDTEGNLARYRLIRSMIETPTTEDLVDRADERLRLLRLTDRGEEDVAAPSSLVNSWLPERLHDIFFTDGDSVQTFISGEVGERQRQARVQHAIRELLSIDRFRVASSDIDAAYRSLLAEAAKSGGQDTSDLERMLEDTVDEIGAIESALERLQERLANMQDQQTSWEKELSNLSGLGDIDELNERIEKVLDEQRVLERHRSNSLVRMRNAIKSSEYSWAFMGDKLQQGLQVLADLADRRVIPGASVEVLADRLELGQCICGEQLSEGTTHRRHVEDLLEQQRQISPNIQRLTALSYVARQASQEEEKKRENGEAFSDTSAQLRRDFTETRDALRSKSLELQQLRERRSNIDEERVRDLSSRIEDVEAKIARTNQEIGAKDTELQLAHERQRLQQRNLSDAQREAAINDELALKRDVAQDLSIVASNVLKDLEGEYVRRVSDRMKQLFMTIVGSPHDPLRSKFGSELFAGVHIDDQFNIIIDAHEGRQLDPDFELNGASKRALTLSFIWALMEVSGVMAPRMIDTPLGMVSGGVKARMVDAITRPPTSDLPDYQVILFLTRSEIRDVEDLIDERAGRVMTLSCSEHYPVDLNHSWGTDYPVSRICSCDHRHSCPICARRYDERHGVIFQDSRGATQ